MAAPFLTGIIVWTIWLASEEAIMFSTIVLALDGSEGSRRALPLAADLAERDGARIVAVHVRELIAAKAGTYPIRADEGEIEAAVRREVEDLSARGLDATLETAAVAMGGPAHAIADIARAAGADLIVVGTRGHGPIAGLLLGSVTQRLLHIATCPVLAVPPS